MCDLLFFRSPCHGRHPLYTIQTGMLCVRVVYSTRLFGVMANNNMSPSQIIASVLRSSPRAGVFALQDAVHASQRLKMPMVQHKSPFTRAGLSP